MSKDTKALYERIWRDFPEYRKYSPAVDGGLLAQFVERCEPEVGSVVGDVGCGVGRSAKWLEDEGYYAYLVDQTKEAVDPGIAEQFGVFERDVREPMRLNFEWVFSVDMLEHLAPGDVPAALDNLIGASSVGCYLVACTTPDAMGPKLVGEPLHLTVKKAPWWREQVQAACGRSKALLFNTWATGRDVAFEIRTQK